MMGKGLRAAGMTGLALLTLATATAAPAHAASRAFVAVNQIQALPANAVAGQSYRLHGLVSNSGTRAAKGRVTLRLLHQDRADLAIVAEADPDEGVDHHPLFRFQIVGLVANCCCNVPMPVCGT